MQDKYRKLSVSVNLMLKIVIILERFNLQTKKSKRLTINSIEFLPQTEVANALMVKVIYFL